MAGDQGNGDHTRNEAWGERSALYTEIVRLRDPGLRPGIATDYPLPELTQIAVALCPDASDLGPGNWDEEAKRLRAAILQAAGRVEHDNYSEAIPVMWGAAENFLEKDHSDRRRAVMQLIFTTRSNYDKRHRKPMAKLLEAELRALYEEAQPPGPSEPPNPVTSSKTPEVTRPSAGRPEATDKAKAADGERHTSVPTPGEDENVDGTRADETAAEAEPELPFDALAPPPSPPETSPPRQSVGTVDRTKSKYHRRILIGLRASVLAVVFGLVLAAVLHLVTGTDLPSIGSEPEPPVESRMPPPLPPPDSVVNARTGQVEASQIERPVPDGARIESGEILRVCNLPSDDPCFLTGLQPPIPARGGDTLEFRIRLHNPSVKPLPKFHISVLFRQGSEAPERDFASLFIVWKSGFLSPINGTNPVQIAFPSKPNRLTYIHGSTKLLDGNKNLVGRLPNGIVAGQGDTGLWLNELGPPRSCPTCNPKKYVRYISFKAEVE